MNWRPIETAPKDGTLVLACNSDSYRSSLGPAYFVAGDNYDGIWFYKGGYDVWDLTHWMPLPPPPETE